MRILLADGKIVERSFLGAVTGYVASAIQIGPQDVRSMRIMARDTPGDFQTAMHQLEHRFTTERVGYVGVRIPTVVKLNNLGAGSMILHAREGMTFLVDAMEDGLASVRDYRYPSDDLPYTIFMLKPSEYEVVA